MRQEQDRLINGHEWKVFPYPGMYGLKIQARLAPFLTGISEIVQGLLKSSKTKGDLLDTDIDIGKLVKAIIENIDGEKTPKLIRDMLYGVRVDGKDAYSDKNFDEIFAANYKELYQGLYFVLEVNFGDVFQMAEGFTNDEEPLAGAQKTS